MFEDIAQFVETQLDSEYIPVQSLTDSYKCRVLGIVVKTKGRWPWGSPSYEPTRYHLEDILREKILETPKTETLTLTPKLSYDFEEVTSSELDVHGNIIDDEATKNETHTVETDFGKIKRCQLESVTTLDELEEL